MISLPSQISRGLQTHVQPPSVVDFETRIYVCLRVCVCACVCVYTILSCCRAPRVTPPSERDRPVGGASVEVSSFHLWLQDCVCL
jgi:hypothetical protein